MTAPHDPAGSPGPGSTEHRAPIAPSAAPFGRLTSFPSTDDGARRDGIRSGWEPAERRQTEQVPVQRHSEPPSHPIYRGTESTGTGQNQWTLPLPTEQPYAASQTGGAQQPPAKQHSWFSIIAFGLAVLIAVVAVVQAMMLVQMHNEVDDLQGQVTEAQRSDNERLQKIEDRTKTLLDAAAVAKQVLPSVFLVHAGDALGTGFAFGKAEGGRTFVLTNHHVVEEAKGEGVTIERQGKTYPARIVKTSPTRDLALLEIRENFRRIQPASKIPSPGEPVVVIGAPLGLDDYVTTGVVSRVGPVPGSSQEFIQFDAAINPGNSGGPVVNAEGKVLGVATAKARDAEAIGLAVPIKAACDAFAVC